MVNVLLTILLLAFMAFAVLTAYLFVTVLILSRLWVIIVLLILTLVLCLTFYGLDKTWRR